MSMPQLRLAAAPPHGLSPAGLTIGDMRGYGRVSADAALVSLALWRAAGCLRTSSPERPLLSLQLDGDVQWVSAYVPGTNVLETVGHAQGAELRVVDFMAVAEGRPGQAEAVPAGRFVRIVTCTEGEASFRLECATPAMPGGTHDALAPGAWYFACSRPMGTGSEAGIAHVRLKAGQSVSFMIGDAPLQGGPALAANALHALGETIHYWTWWSDRCRYKSEDFDARLREALTLKLAFGAGSLYAAEPGVAGFAHASLGEATRAAEAFLALGYRNECASLLAQVYEEGREGASRGRWSFDEPFLQTLDAYVLRYGTLGLADDLRRAAEAQDPVLQCTKRMA
ncbi:hypothetical protein [Luteibacter aegosomatissinici]|uniref:hypothetical protein n=1 Tax=Luteibacter aegosomatissinici TaxID=2911539 RepID=UPI001FFB6805|nr:hypothetical protein [Luteibacter aegosomatissinici]UPG95154.1 hypothetical protein L2Y97_03330 [Luteibacter aegosomatissinici]